MEICSVDHDHSDVAVLTEAVQSEYRILYGGDGDESVVDSAQFRPPRGLFLVGYVEGRPVAMGGWRRLAAGSGAPGVDPAEIKRMYVVPAARGAGLSRAILAEIESSASAAGVDWLVLETGLEQPAAVHVYRSSGYTDVDGRFAHYYGDDLSVQLGKQLDEVDSVGQPA